MKRPAQRAQQIQEFSPSMSKQEIADLMFGDDVAPPLHWERKFPLRELPEGAWVTRFAPSPTGYLHTGGLYAAIIAQDLARWSGGVFFIRIENTDAAREIDDARRQFGTAFDYFSIRSDEDEYSPWAPYEQAKRTAIYETYARLLVERGAAYPCFCTHDDLNLLAERQRTGKITPGYYGEWAACRSLDRAEVERRLRTGADYAVRFRAPDGSPDRIRYYDLIRGSLEQLDNRNDAVILKSSEHKPRLPTYHFAHAVDDHLMRVNLVTRGEEWIPSVPLHLQLFRALNFAPPAYAHIAPLMKIDGKSRRKLSKRKDPEASVEHHMRLGYPAEAVRIYLRGLANGNLADIEFPEAARTPLRLDRMGVAGPVFDLMKLESIGRSYIAELPPTERLDAIEAWAQHFDPPLAAILDSERDFVLRAFEYERLLDANPRKDVAKWSDFLPAYRTFLPSQVEPVTDPADPRFAPTDPQAVRAIVADFARSYVHESEKEKWFDQIRDLASRHRFAPTTGDFKRNPEQFVGPLSEASNVVRVVLTGQRRSPDLFLISQVIGEGDMNRRMKAMVGDLGASHFSTAES